MCFAFLHVMLCFGVLLTCKVYRDSMGDMHLNEIEDEVALE